MKKLLTCLLAVTVLFTAAACGKGDSDVSYDSSKDVLNTVVEAKELAFPALGGTFENPVDGQAGELDITNEEQLDSVALPKEQMKNVSDAANLTHAMNANLFTAAAFKLKDNVNAEDFSKAYLKGIENRQWLCGAPSLFVVIDAGDNYVITIYGDGEVIESFKDTALESLDGSKILVEQELGI